MTSIENFYYVLYRHLLAPLNLQDVMSMKFGSVELDDMYFSFYGTSQFRYRRRSSMENNCFFFDQEPINNTCAKNLAIFTLTKYCQLLANSEISSVKKALCKELQYQDWYYFFHGFAALDWYRDAQYFCQDIEWTRPYMSLNRLHVNDRSYRLNLVARLSALDILQHGHVSLHLEIGDYGNWKQELQDPNTKLSKEACILISKELNQPLILDREHIGANASADLGHREFELWKSGLWHIVTETVFYYNKLHLTEKIFKPIVAQRPFMLAAAPGNLAYLKSYGFETFDRWIDESYDTITDPDQRLQAVAEQTQKLCAMSHEDLRAMHQEMLPVLKHNFDHFYGDFKKKIAYELVDNFETAVRQWNNGRIDGKELPLHKVDLAGVKKILSR